MSYDTDVSEETWDGFGDDVESVTSDVAGDESLDESNSNGENHVSSDEVRSLSTTQKHNDSTSVPPDNQSRPSLPGKNAHKSTQVPLINQTPSDPAFVVKKSKQSSVDKQNIPQPALAVEKFGKPVSVSPSDSPTMPARGRPRRAVAPTRPLVDDVWDYAIDIPCSCRQCE